MTTPQALEHPKRFAAEAPDRIAVIVGDRTISYGEMEAQSNALAHALREAGLRAGDQVALVMENRPEWFSIVWGVLRSGLLVTPINWHLSAEEAHYILRDCGARALIASAGCEDIVRGELPAELVARFSVGGDLDGYEPYERVLRTRPTTPIDDELEGHFMFYSSGTTGRPKGIRPQSVGQPLGAPNSFVGLVRGLYGGGEDTVYLSPAPLYHAAPAGWGTAVHRLGGTVISMPKFDPVELLETIERHRATLVQLVPTHLVRLLKLPAEVRAKYDLSSLRKVVHAAAPCPPDVKRAALEWLGPIVYEYYSGSEGVGFCAIGPQEWLEHPGSVGRSLLGPVHILGPDGLEVPPGEEGQVWFEPPGRFEYHGDPEKTAAAFNDRGYSTFGELGRLDEDGYLYLTDRVSNMIISGGVNIYPREVEDALIGHPDVVDLVVIGISDPEMGEAVRAVVQSTAMPEDPAALEADLIAFCRERIAHFKCPRSVRFVPLLPRMDTGKVARRLLPDELRR